MIKIGTWTGPKPELTINHFMTIFLVGPRL